MCPENAMYESHIIKYLERIAINTHRIADELERQNDLKDTIDKIKQTLIEEGLAND